MSASTYRLHPALTLHDVVSSVDDSLGRSGFERRSVTPTVVDDSESTTDEKVVAVWVRYRADVPGHREEAVRRGLDADWASAWTDHVHLRVAGVTLEVKWAQTPLSSEEITHAIDQFISAVDRAAPADGGDA